jgi:hypothetical protein
MISGIDIEDMGPPQIQVEAVDENEDGSMNCLIHMNAAGTKLLIEMGFTSMLMKAVEQLVKNHEIHPDN